jgi:hypothetical protein
VRRCWEQRFSIVPVALIFNNSVGWKIQSLEQILICVEVNQLTKQNSILPALAFSLDMFSKTHQSYGVNEVLLASVLGSVVFSMFAAQPLVIVGVTGTYPRTLIFTMLMLQVQSPSSTTQSMTSLFHMASATFPSCVG